MKSRERLVRKHDRQAIGKLSLKTETGRRHRRGGCVLLCKKSHVWCLALRLYRGGLVGNVVASSANSVEKQLKIETGFNVRCRVIF